MNVSAQGEGARGRGRKGGQAYGLIEEAILVEHRGIWLLRAKLYASLFAQNSHSWLDKEICN